MGNGAGLIRILKALLPFITGLCTAVLLNLQYPTAQNDTSLNPGAFGALVRAFHLLVGASSSHNQNMSTSQTRSRWLQALLPLAITFLTAGLLNILGAIGHNNEEEANLGTDPATDDTVDKKQIQQASGPQLQASLGLGFCGKNELNVSRLPVNGVQGASWSVLLSTLHPSDSQVSEENGQLVASAEDWEGIATQPLAERNNVSGVPITRTTLVNMLLLSNARPTFSYADASGYRAGFASWIGQWYITWPASQPAVVSLRPHDSHTAATDVYPPTFRTRLDCCVNMMAGVVIRKSDPRSLRLAFPSRPEPGTWRLSFQPKAFAGSHGSRHIYNMNGAKVYSVDYLALRRGATSNDNSKSTEHALELRVPSTTAGEMATILVYSEEQHLLRAAMDVLPWSSISWSMHRGMKDILLAYSKHTMDLYREALAEKLRLAPEKYFSELTSMGWESVFVKDYMGDMAASAVLAGRGNSADLVRIVTCLAELLCSDIRNSFDETSFWTRRRTHSDKQTPGLADFDSHSVIGLVKCFILEWSVDFDYQMYHDIPIDLLLV